MSGHANTSALDGRLYPKAEEGTTVAKEEEHSSAKGQGKARPIPKGVGGTLV